MKSILTAFTALALFSTPALSQAGNGEEADTNHFSALDVFDLEYATDPQVAPDGDHVAYVRRSNDIMRDRTRSNIWIASADGESHRPLLSGQGNYSSPRWSPDGTRLAYVSAEEGSSQIYVRWMDTGDTVLVTNVADSPRGIRWSPDGETLAFSMNVPAEKTKIAGAPPKPEGAEWKPAPVVIDSVIYRFDGRGFIEPAYTHIFTVPAEGGAARQVTEGDYNFAGRFGGSFAWSADGSEIYISANFDENWEMEWFKADLYAVDVETGELRRLTDTPELAESVPVTSPDGGQLAFTFSSNAPQPYATDFLATIETDGGNFVNWTEGFDRSVGNIQWGEDGDSIYFQYDNRGKVKLARLDGPGEEIEVLTDTLSGTTLGRPYSSGTFNTAGGTVAYTHGTPYRPADLAVVAGDGPRMLTDLNADLLDHRDLGEVREIVYESSLDGTEIQGWYILPPGFDPDQKYPLILELHGGPHSSYGPHFAPELQRMAAEGYVVFYPNYRGSTGYGEEFALKLMYKYSSPDDFADNMSGVDAMIDMGFIDEDNLFITGGSAGGISSAYAIGLTDRFNSAVVAKPVINWLSKTLTGDIYIFQIRNQFPAMPWEDPMHYWERSPLSLVGNMTTPTMLLTGEEDLRTPISESEQLYQALKLKGVDTVMVRIPGSFHGIAGSAPSRLNAKVDHILAWFEKYRTDREEEEAE